MKRHARAITFSATTAAVLATALASVPAASETSPMPNRSASADSAADESALPPGVTQAEHERRAAVEEYVQKVISSHSQNLNPAVLWDEGRIVLAATDRTDPQVAHYDDDVVEGLEVDVVNAEYTQAEYEQAIKNASRAESPAADAVEYFNLPAGSQRIEVAVRDFNELSTSARSSLETSLETAAGVDLTLVKTSGRWELASRQNGSAPWRGGGSMRHQIDSTHYGYCSTGFPVLAGSAGRLLSAAHCDESTGATPWGWTDFAGDDQLAWGGNVQLSRGIGLDSMLINPVGGTEGYVHGGPWNATTATPRYLLHVNGASPTFIGAFVCTSGANSGEHCGGIRVDEHADVSCWQLGLCHRWIARSTNGSIVLAGGDSGGPVFSSTANPDYVGARGIIRSGNGNVSCPSTATGAGPCYSAVMFIGIMDVLDFWNVQIETAP